MQYSIFPFFACYCLFFLKIHRFRLRTFFVINSRPVHIKFIYKTTRFEMSWAFLCLLYSYPVHQLGMLFLISIIRISLSEEMTGAPARGNVVHCEDLALCRWVVEYDEYPVCSPHSNASCQSVPRSLAHSMRLTPEWERYSMQPILLIEVRWYLWFEMEIEL